MKDLARVLFDLGPRASIPSQLTTVPRKYGNWLQTRPPFADVSISFREAVKGPVIAPRLWSSFSGMRVRRIPESKLGLAARGPEVHTTYRGLKWNLRGGIMVFLFVSLACFALFLAIFAATFAIDHFASMWETADAKSWRGHFSSWATNNKTLDVVKGLSGVASAFACLAFLVAIFYALTLVGVANGDYCGLADSSLELKSGDTAYIRVGRPPTGQRRPPGWTITADEAKSLAATGQFTIDNK